MFDLTTNLILMHSSISGAHFKTNPHQEDAVTVTSHVVETNQKLAEDEEAKQQTAFGKALYDLTHSERALNDLTCGRRVGFYELRGEIGSGNFSQVRLGIHDLTKGEIFTFYFEVFMLQCSVYVNKAIF